MKRKIPYVRMEAVPNTGVVNYSVEQRSIDWQDFDKVLNVGDWLKINFDRKLVLAKYSEFKAACILMIILIFLIGLFVGGMI